MNGKQVIVVGAASGIAAATPAELERRGARVVCLNIDTERTGLIVCDVHNQYSVDRAAAEALASLGGAPVRSRTSRSM
ncbi:MAG TPA: hypothetical protein VGL54_03760 [Solirubrobacteraceae bacterium]|jgi:NAD(P)-dependent dehydrogenase (short-subunit alcohol dehydrogenase family)